MKETPSIAYAALPNVSRQVSPFKKSAAWENTITHDQHSPPRHSVQLSKDTAQGSARVSQSAANHYATEKTGDGLDALARLSWSEHFITPDKRIQNKYTSPHVLKKNSDENIVSSQVNKCVFATRQSLSSGILHASPVVQTVEDFETTLRSAALECGAADYSQVSTPTDHRSPALEGLHLSPLSPDVCTERGPSRYHEDCKAHVSTVRSPIRPRSLSYFQKKTSTGEPLTEEAQHQSRQRSTGEIGHQAGRRVQRPALGTSH